MNKKLSLFGLLIISSILVSCSPTNDKLENQVTIQKDGKIIGNTIEEFGNSNYSVEELQELLDQEIVTYNNKAGVDSIIAKPLELMEDKNETKVYLHTTYKSAADYEAFNNVTLFIGSIEEAIGQGFDLNVSLVDAKDPTEIIKINKLENPEEWTLLITDDLIKVKTPGNVAYCLPEITVIEGNEQDKKYSYFMYK